MVPHRHLRHRGAQDYESFPTTGCSPARKSRLLPRTFWMSGSCVRKSPPISRPEPPAEQLRENRNSRKNLSRQRLGEGGRHRKRKKPRINANKSEGSWVSSGAHSDIAILRCSVCLLFVALYWRSPDTLILGVLEREVEFSFRPATGRSQSDDRSSR
jgi:hypothetical protein